MPRPTSDSADATPDAAAATRAVPRIDWAMRRPKLVVLFLIVAALAAAADLVSKHVVFERILSDPDTADRVSRLLEHNDLAIQDSQEFTRLILQHADLSREILPGVMDFTLSTNPGVVFGFDWIPRVVVNLFTAAAIIFVLGFFGTSHRRAHVLHVALAMILGGAIGNLYDRLFSAVSLPGLPTPIRYHVRDFIDCSDIGYGYVFNLADAWLVIGLGMIGMYWLWSARQEARAAKAKQKADKVT